MLLEITHCGGETWAQFILLHGFGPIIWSLDIGSWILDIHPLPIPHSPRILRGWSLDIPCRTLDMSSPDLKLSLFLVKNPLFFFPL